jgi:predicted ATPase
VSKITPPSSRASKAPLLDLPRLRRLQKQLNGNYRCRIVLTGGPGGGKTTAADLFRREIGQRVVIVPEAATLVFSGGFPRCTERHAVMASQRAIFHVQRNLEDVQSAQYPDRILLCDRGTVDGAAYWPDEDPMEFFAAQETTLEQELARYDGVIFFESAAVGGLSIEGGNPIRNESLEQAVALDARLRALWSQHPRFIIVRHNPSFFKKISFALAVLEGMVAELNGRPGTAPVKPAKKRRS